MVGSHLLPDLIRSGEKVRAIYRNEDRLRQVKKVFSYNFSEEEAENLFQSIEWVPADITDIPSLEKVFEGVRKVYHCAALISFDPSRDSQLRKTNIEGTANVVNYCIKNKVEKLAFVSSIATLDKKPEENVVTEESHWNKEKHHSMYAITKYGAEMEVWRASQEGIPVVIVNPGVIIGPGYWDSGSGQIFKKLHKGLKYYFPKTTGFVGVEDVVKTLQILMDSKIVNDQFIVVSENLSFQKVLGMAAESMGKPAPKKEIKPWMVRTGWFLQSLQNLFTGKGKQLDSKSHRTLFENTFYSNEKLISRLGYSFSPVKRSVTFTGKIFNKEFKK